MVLLCSWLRGLVLLWTQARKLMVKKRARKKAVGAEKNKQNEAAEDAAANEANMVKKTQQNKNIQNKLVVHTFLLSHKL